MTPARCKIVYLYLTLFVFVFYILHTFYILWPIPTLFTHITFHKSKKLHVTIDKKNSLAVYDDNLLLFLISIY